MRRRRRVRPAVRGAVGRRRGADAARQLRLEPQIRMAERSFRRVVAAQPRMTGPVILTLTREFDAPAEGVFDAWLNPADARRFLFATPEGDMQTVEIDARVGGRALIVEGRAAGGAHHRMQFEAIARPTRRG